MVPFQHDTIYFLQIGVSSLDGSFDWVRIQIGWNESKKDGYESWVHFWFSFASESSVWCVDFIFWFIVWGLVSPCGQSFVDIAFLLPCAICCLIYASLKGLCDCLPSTFPLPPLLLLLPTWGIEYFVRKKSPFGNCLFHKLSADTKGLDAVFLSHLFWKLCYWTHLNQWAQCCLQ